MIRKIIAKKDLESRRDVKRAEQKGIAFKKYKIDNILCIVIGLVMIISCTNVYALGVAPSKKIIDYDTDQHIISSRIINSEGKDLTVKISAEGELSQYIYIANPIIHIDGIETEKEFAYVLQLPPGINPGPKTIRIIISEISDTDVDAGINNATSPGGIKENENAVGGMLTITQQLQINVPYSGLYAEEYLSVYAANSSDINSEVNVLCEVRNAGDQIINTISGTITVTDMKDAYKYNDIYNDYNDYNDKYNETGEATEIDPGRIVYSKEISAQNNIFPKESARIEDTFKLNKAGIYTIECDVTYDGKEVSIKKNFNLGEYNITIIDTQVRNFRLGTIAKFDISLLSEWNKDINDVYGEVIVMEKNGAIVGRTNISKTTISPANNMLSAYLDTVNMKPGEYKVGIKLYAGSRIILQEYPARIGTDSIEIDTSGINTEEAFGKTSRWSTIRAIALILLAICMITILLIRQNKKIYK